MKKNRGKIQFVIDSTQRAPITHKKSDPLEQEKGQNHQQNHGKREKQSKILGTHLRENDEKDDELETTHEELANEEPTAAKSHVEDEREMEEKQGGPRERLKRHRTEVAGHVWIPDLWGQEELLVDWIDCSAFDSSLVPQGILSARASLIDEGRRASSAGIRVQNSC